MSIVWQRVLLFLVPLAIAVLAKDTPYVLTLLTFALINGVVTMATCFSMGRAGQITLAQAGFVAIGAYCAMLLNLRLGLPFWVGLPAAIVLSGVIGYLLSKPIMKLKGHYMALVTLAFSLVVAEVAMHWTSLTNGASGLFGVQLPHLPWLSFSPQFEFALMLTVYWMAVYLFADNLIRSRYGRAMQAQKHSDAGAQACGIDTVRVKTEAVVISAAMMGGAGAFYAYFIRYIGPESFTIEMSITIIAMAILGGITDLRGAIVGSALLTVLNEPLRAYPTIQPMVYAIIIMAAIIFLPRGIVPSMIEAATRRKLSRPSPSPRTGVPE